MLATNKVIWKEGLFLQPQHFQQFERFIFNSIQRRVSSYIAHFFGLTDYTIDTDAVANGTFSITQAQGIMPDGTVFDIPKQNSLPPARSFEEHFTIEQQRLDVFLALPMVIENIANTHEGSNINSSARYKSHLTSVCDEVYGKLKKDIELGDLNFTILFGDESRDNYSSMQIARLVRKSSGQIEIDDNYIPPILHIGASRVLLDKIRSLLELLLAKNVSLSQGRKQLKGGFAEFGGTEQTAFYLLYAINTYTPLLNHFHFIPNVHPYDLFTLLIQFAGALCTFSTEVTIRKLPKYEHNNLNGVFSTFDGIIRQVLGGDVSAGCINIPIEEVGPANYLCKITDMGLFISGTFYFGVSADIPEKELTVGVLSRIKMCSREKLELLIPSAMPGLPLMHVANPPSNLSTKPGYIYFRLDKQGDFWEGIKASGTIAFYFPHQYSNLKMEMIVLKK